MKQAFEYVQSFATILLILAGIGGVAYDLFRKDGWLGIILDRFWSAQMDHPMVAIPFTIAVVVIGKLWYSHQVSKGYTSKLPNVLIYVVMLAGLYYVWRIYTDLASV